MAQLLTFKYCLQMQSVIRLVYVTIYDSCPRLATLNEVVLAYK